MSLAQDLENALIPTVEALGFELLCLELGQDGHDALLRLYIDKADGITVDDCARVSRAVSTQLEVEDPIAGAYRLEVSSPGWDRPLAKPAHFAMFMGELAKVRTHMPVEDRRNFRGRIVALDEDAVHLEVDGETFVVPFADIERARLVPPADGPVRSEQVD
ncbi:MAG: ribosome maturation factor RimP [Oceanococcaceae bacterium]